MDCGLLVLPEHLRHTASPLPERILIRTRRFAADVWEPGFAGISPDTLTWLHGRGVKLVGIDTPSIDPAESKTFPGHRKIFEYGMRVLECLVLDDVPEADYELIALPLKLSGACASPVRAVLMPKSPTLHQH
jgi:arylformamidase